MKYFTRDRHHRSQDDIGLNEDAQAREMRLSAASEEWRNANNEYNEYLENIHSKLPESLRYLSEIILQDARVVSASRDRDEAELLIRLGKAFWYPTNVSQIEMRFHGVAFEAGLGDASGQWLLYHEIAVAGELYQLSALLDKTEILVEFRDLEIAISPRERGDHA